MRVSRPGQLVAGVALLAAVAVAGGVEAQPQLLQVRYTLQPDCYRPSLNAPCDARKTGNRLDLGPQIAIWIESADRTRFIDTLLVTNATALRGIGNRPGHWSLPSSPKFPYGKRLMALPVWAHARGKLFPPVVMQGDPEQEFWLGFHEAISSPDPYYCRPMSASEIDVDAVSCPTAVFNSAKGKLSQSEPKIYYPPRNDLRMFTDRDCDSVDGQAAGCPMSARKYADLNDLDAVAAATPPYGKPFQGVWTVPADLPEGDYALLVEVNKEFDNNGAHNHPAFTDMSLSDSGLKNNFGQPSVVYRVTFHLSRSAPFSGATMDIAGYGDWDGASGTLHASDKTITEGPGSGRGRLMAMRGPGGAMGRVFLSSELVVLGTDAGADDGATTVPGALDAGASDALAPSGCAVPMSMSAGIRDLTVPADGIEAEEAVVRFVEPGGDVFKAIERYDVRVWEGSDQTEAAFASGTPAERLVPVRAGQPLSVRVRDLKGGRDYTVGVKAVGACVDGAISYAGFATTARKFSTLSGCFIATAAYGSAQAAGVAALRRARDAARRGSSLAAAAAALYERASPPLADVLRDTAVGRAVVRRALAPLVDAVEALAPRPR